jgi:hypothetical protein
LTGEPIVAPIVDIADGPVDARAAGAIVLFDLAFEMPLARLQRLTEYRYDPAGMLRRPAVRDARKRRHGLAATNLLFATAIELFGDDGIPTDAAYVLAAGVPTVSLISGPLYLYDDVDTLDKIDVEQLAPVARSFADLIDAADTARPAWIGLIPRPLRRLLRSRC